MASAQVLPNSVASSRKQGHLEAGKKRLEEFRKKKAAKKASSAGQLPSADADHYEKLSQNNGNMVDGPTSTIDSDIVMSPPVPIGPDERNFIDSSQNIEFRSFGGTSATSTAQFTRNFESYDDSLQEVEKNEVHKLHGNSGFSNVANGYYDNWRENNEFIPSMGNNFGSPSKDQYLAIDMVHSKTSIDENISTSGFPTTEVLPDGNRNSSTIYLSASDPSRSYHNSKLPEKLESNSMQNRVGIDSSSAQTSGNEDSASVLDNSKLGGSLSYGNTSGTVKGGAEIANAINRHLKVNSEHWQASEPSSTDFSATFKGSSNVVSSISYGTTSDRSRPSFLDSLGVNKVSKSQMPYKEARKANSVSSFDNSKDEELFSQWQPSLENNSVDHSNLRILDINSEKESFMNSTIPLRNDQGVKHNMESYQNFPPHGQDEDFAALEQHIEDLTQEKFSLQRALDKSQMLAQNLAAENSSLTESYNQQGKVINQLKSDMEKLQEEIKAQFLALDSVQMEYANAQLECSAADERAKILASEVISLEEKALRLRSNELKLEKQVENLNSEISSFRRKVSILEKEHQDFQFTIDALQEERKLLQSKLRKASVSENGNEEKKPYSDRRDAATLTEDLELQNELFMKKKGLLPAKVSTVKWHAAHDEFHGAEHLDMARGESSFHETMLDSTLNTSEDVGPSVSLASSTSGTSVIYEDTSVGIPQDQIRMIGNISSLISELAVEREEMMRALKIESSNCFMLKDLNKDLTQKLEAQTQRLELLTAQQMANEVVLTKPIDMHIINDTTQYADEGDEVVERVLGWIMKLFPGGPAKRRTSKLL
ncbi:protein BLISTER isoform X1 [Typha angustifolia]|uniref:protein BLISTER isoform X1 n=1 Tax=Typha angustifolia TaxID=59011 RepID=UPI003C2E9526